MSAEPRFKGVLIDLWGTLVPVGLPESRLVHLQTMAQELGVDPVVFERDWAASLRERCVGALGPLEETIRTIALRQGRAPSAEAIERAVDVRLDFSRRALSASAPMIPALDALRSAGLRLALVSDASEEAPRLWPSLELGARFEAAVFSCVNGFCKPDPRAYQRALDRLGLAPGECAYIGDGDSRELTGARSVGLEPFLFRCPAQSTEWEYRSLPDLEWKGQVLADIRDLLTA